MKMMMTILQLKRKHQLKLVLVEEGKLLSKVKEKINKKF
jgi:hypothetical protein